jgi:ATP-dependent Clp protease adapter protein ClpS
LALSLYVLHAAHANDECSGEGRDQMTKGPWKPEVPAEPVTPFSTQSAPPPRARVTTETQTADQLTAVIMLNDEVTPMDIATEVLIKVFQQPPDVAEELMMEVHNTGEAIVAEVDDLLALTAAYLRLEDDQALQFRTRPAHPDEHEGEAAD